MSENSAKGAIDRFFPLLLGLITVGYWATFHHLFDFWIHVFYGSIVLVHVLFFIATELERRG